MVLVAALHTKETNAISTRSKAEMELFHYRLLSRSQPGKKPQRRFLTVSLRNVNAKSLLQVVTKASFVYHQQVRRALGWHSVLQGTWAQVLSPFLRFKPSNVTACDCCSENQTQEKQRGLFWRGDPRIKSYHIFSQPSDVLKGH